ncbi:fibronectin type III domain-containing protein [Kutzneria albida]|uniref:Fibronectin type-III domain-containing protein n=1 Tax=Kutzneria albida DSM 43870 TaxID=1449976 RepID=W5WDM7_9PSEU|nr:fibronectin type III domain-containing protein [Kutzneria albida]AHH99283.1 hypothetical protein KALB_5922 [Kutzneria albida DSM 43870]
MSVVRARLGAVLLVLGLAACTADSGLTATRTGSTEIRLTWPAAPDTALGQVLEYRNQAGGEFTELAFLPANATSYTHSELIPRTDFYYRVRTVFGRESTSVAVALPTGSGPAAPEGDWAAPRSRPSSPGPHNSLRDKENSGAGPTDLHAEAVGTDGVHLSWTDHARDEDGYLLEVTPANGSAVRVAAVLGPGVNEVGVYPLEQEHTASYRVAAFYYGQTSSVAHETTGA